MVETFSRMKKRRNAEKKLLAHNKKALREIYLHIDCSSLAFKEKEEAKHELLDLLLAAQQDNRSAELILEDAKEFSKAVIREYEQKNNRMYRLLHHIGRGCLFVVLLLFLSAFANLILRQRFAIRLADLALPLAFSFILLPNMHRNKFIVNGMYLLVTMWLISCFELEPSFVRANDLSTMLAYACIAVGSAIFLLVQLYKHFYHQNRRYH